MQPITSKTENRSIAIHRLNMDEAGNAGLKFGVSRRHQPAEANTQQSKAKKIAEQKYKEVLKTAEKSKKSDDNDKNEPTEDKEVQRKAEKERKKIYDEILKKCQKKRSLANAKLRKAKAEFKKAIAEAARKVEKLVAKAHRIDRYVNYMNYLTG
ncbi:unnamed protein product [Ilex paraguariensis]|uniref:Uncharacterized protein n=1 Tax=Ilex paraguariensis TaxID=185542 RepID=A0ABC8QLU6_9AQUA